MNILTVMDIKRINMGGETDSPTNHEKVRASKRKTKMQTVWKTRQTGIINGRAHGPGWTLD